MSKSDIFHLNVEQGLQDVGLAEYKEEGKIMQGTDMYLNSQTQIIHVGDCVRNLTLKQSVYIEDFA